MNQRISKAAHIKELNSEIDKLKEELFATREKNGVYLPADHWESQQVTSCCIRKFLFQATRLAPPEYLVLASSLSVLNQGLQLIQICFCVVAFAS